MYSCSHQVNLVSLSLSIALSKLSKKKNKLMFRSALRNGHDKREKKKNKCPRGATPSHASTRDAANLPTRWSVQVIEVLTSSSWAPPSRAYC
jgi:hypothetical protein